MEKMPLSFEEENDYLDKLLDYSDYDREGDE